MQRLLAASIFAGLLVIAWSVFELQRIFLAEHQRALANLEARGETIRGYAAQRMRSALEARIQEAWQRIEAVQADPLLADQSLFWREGRTQRLPLLWQFAPGPDRAELHYHSLEARLQQDHVPATDAQLHLLWDLKQAIGAGEAESITLLVRDWLRLQIRYRSEAALDLPYRLHLLELLAAYPASSPQLLNRLLREGLDDGAGNRIEGLQRDLLRRRNNLSEADFEFLLQQTLNLSNRLQVRSDDLARIAAARSLEPWPSDIGNWDGTRNRDNNNSEPLLWQQQWYFQPQEDAALGVRVDLPALLAQIRTEMQTLGLLAENERLNLILPAAPLMSLRDLGYEWQSDAWQRSRAELDKFHRAKTALLSACLVLLAAILLLTGLVYLRQKRWVDLKSDFVATVSHEIRTPLSSVRLMAERLQNKLGSNERAQDYPQRMLADIDNLSFLVENILSYERLNSGKWVVHNSNLSLMEIIEQLRAELPLYTQKPFSLNTEGDPEASLYADPLLMKLLFMNLAKNSCYYNESQEVRIQFSWHQSAKGLEVRITDNGIGILAKEAEDVFQPFYRGSSQRHTGGSGLGLALCRKIAALHQAKLSLGTSNGEGTTFVLLFPHNVAQNSHA